MGVTQLQDDLCAVLVDQGICSCPVLAHAGYDRFRRGVTCHVDVLVGPGAKALGETIVPCVRHDVKCGRIDLIAGLADESRDSLQSIAHCLLRRHYWLSQGRPRARMRFVDVNQQEEHLCTRHRLRKSEQDVLASQEWGSGRREPADEQMLPVTPLCMLCYDISDGRGRSRVAHKIHDGCV